MSRGVGWPWQRRGGHASVRVACIRCEGRHGRHGRVPGGVNGGAARAGRSGPARARVGRSGWLRRVHACRVLDSGSGRQSTGDCGQGRGSWCEGCHGESQGDTGKLLDVLVAGFWCWFAKWPWWWPCPWHGCLGLGFRAWGVWLLSRTCRGALGVLLDKLV